MGQRPRLLLVGVEVDIGSEGKGILGHPPRSLSVAVGDPNRPHPPPPSTNKKRFVYGILNTYIVKIWCFYPLLRLVITSSLKRRTILIQPKLY